MNGSRSGITLEQWPVTINHFPMMLSATPTAHFGRPRSSDLSNSAIAKDYFGQDKIYSKGKFIYLFRDQYLSTLVLEKGFVRLGFYAEDGEETTTAVLKPGDLFGNFFSRPCTDEEFAQALTEVQVKTIDQITFNRLLAVCSPFTYEFISMLEARFQRLEQHMMMNAANARERTVLFFQFLARQCGYRQPDAVVIDNFLTHEDLARITNVSRQTISTCLNQLQEEELLRYTRKQVVLLPAFPNYGQLAIHLQ